MLEFQAIGWNTEGGEQKGDQGFAKQMHTLPHHNNDDDASTLYFLTLMRI